MVGQQEICDLLEAGDKYGRNYRTSSLYSKEAIYSGVTATFNAAKKEFFALGKSTASSHLLIIATDSPLELN